MHLSVTRLDTIVCIIYFSGVFIVCQSLFDWMIWVREKPVSCGKLEGTKLLSRIWLFWLPLKLKHQPYPVSFLYLPIFEMRQQGCSLSYSAIGIKRQFKVSQRWDSSLVYNREHILQKIILGTSLQGLFWWGVIFLMRRSLVGKNMQ